MAACPGCGRENADDARFCSQCGALISGLPLRRDERRVVTVLFCDLVGFTERAERLDPEDVRSLLNAYHAHVRRDIERHGGTVEKFIGDAVMAVFGATAVHEDDPERAVRAALAIRDWAGERGDVSVRIGIVTGEALLTLGARAELGESIVAGDVVNSAARLQAAAPVNTVLVGATTYRATRDAIEYGPDEPISVKGRSDPLVVREALSARARLGVDVRQLSTGPLVGRDEELAALVNAFNRARREAEPQLVTIVGVPGIGKSRLVAELLRRVEAEPDLVRWRQGRCLPYGEGVAFWALREIITAEAGILESDSAAAVDDKLSLITARLGADARLVGERLRPLLGLSSSPGRREGPEAGRPEAFVSWRRFVEGLAAERPSVFVFEDLHWADDGLLDFIDHLVDWATGGSILVVATARPELLARRPGWSGGKPNAMTLSLRPLSDMDTERVLRESLRRLDLPEDVEQSLLERAGGNPLYAEEFARLVAEHEHGREIPETVHALISARLDSLGPDEKATLQDAAVVGKVFWLGSLGENREQLEQRLHDLVRREFIKPERPSSVEGESEYAFRHILIRDVAYGQIPRAERARKHQRVAAWIASLGRAEDRAEMLAYHYARALDYATVSGAPIPGLREAAREALRSAGDRALALNSFNAAERFYGQAADLWPADSHERARLLLEQGLARAELGTAESLLLDAVKALAPHGDSEGLADAERALAHLEWRRGNRDAADRHISVAMSLVKQRQASATTARVLSEFARLHMVAGRAAEASESAKDAITIAEQIGLTDVLVHATDTLATATTFGERASRAKAMPHFERSIALGREHGLLETGRTYNNLGVSLVVWGDLRAAADIWEEGRRFVAQFGETDTARWLAIQRIPQYWWSGRWDEALSIADEAVAHELGYPQFVALEMRARMRLARGELEEAAEDAARALEVARQAKDLQAVVPCLSNGARVAAERGHRDEALALVDELLDVGPLASIAHPGAPGCDLAWVVRSFGLERDRRGAALVEAWRSAPDDVWLAAAAVVVAGDLTRAADIYGGAGHEALEAEASLAAARAGESGARLERAVEFFRRAGATSRLREAEQLR